MSTRSSPQRMRKSARTSANSGIAAMRLIALGTSAGTGIWNLQPRSCVPGILVPSCQLDGVIAKAFKSSLNWRSKRKGSASSLLTMASTVSPGSSFSQIGSLSSGEASGNSVAIARIDFVIGGAELSRFDMSRLEPEMNMPGAKNTESNSLSCHQSALTTASASAGMTDSSELEDPSSSQSDASSSSQAKSLRHLRHTIDLRAVRAKELHDLSHQL
eukprot:CAMPEP_0179118992 /NCGR_PEP_ID=MMETSP0796-20121207/55995_1 /TAXON_ID=73915 /ORGANISM="Pyrodinium bahamense, Strain pbaha01" /LENGTH=215 /DNA_ID=CAMNT_0020817479 /DNA_START=395 /DNA_END=1039 /DNA_ORIENTATION=+